MREITLTVRGDTVHASRHRAGVQGECNATALVVAFDESWDGYSKKITFWDALEQNPVVRWLTNELLVNNDTRTYQTTIPGEPLKEAGECTLVIDGLRGETVENEFVADARARSISVRLTVEAAPLNDSADDPDDPRLDQYEQVVAQITNNAVKAENAAKVAAQYSTHPPIIGENGNWWLWDGTQYVDSGRIAEPETDETLSIAGRPADAEAVGDELKYRAQGQICEMTLHSAGWKRVATLIRGNSGFADIVLSINSDDVGKTAQNVVIGYSGFVSHPSLAESDKKRTLDPNGHPRLWQMVSHTRGENANTTDPQRIFRIDKVRLCYPKNIADVDTSVMTAEEKAEYTNPVNIYMDVHVVCNDPDFDWTTIKPPPYGQVGLECNITGHVKNHRVEPVIGEITVEDENPTGFNGVVCETYELELEDDTQLKIPGYSKVKELAVDKLYSLKQMQYDLNSGADIPGRKGSVRLLGLEVSEQGVPFYVQPVCENMVVDYTPDDKSGNYGMRLTRHANGIYEARCTAASGKPSTTTYIALYEQFPRNSAKAPIVLKAGVRYVVSDAWLHVISYEYYEAVINGTGKMPSNSVMTSIHGTDSDRYGRAFKVIEAVDYDRVVARISVHFKADVDYNGRCFYPQLCREGVEVIDPALTSDNPRSLVTRPVPYTPKPTKMADHNDKQYSRIRGMAYANELRVFNMDYPDLTGTATLETAVDFVDALVEVLPAGPGAQGPQGEKGDTGDSAYDVAVKNGFEGTEAEWLESLVGTGSGTGGADGYTPQKGVDYYTEADKQEMVNLVLAALPVVEEVRY